MHRLLFRQLKKTMGFGTVEEAQRWLDELAGYAKDNTLPPAILTLLNGMIPFVKRVDTSYQQQQRDVEIRDRSIRLSSQELTEALEQARQDAVTQQQALSALQHTANTLLRELDKPPLSEDSGDLSGLAELMTQLSRERHEALREVEIQRQAIDQHAIIAVVDSNREILYANSKLCEISGFSEGELIGNRLDLLRSGYHREETYRSIWDTAGSGKVWHGEIHNHTKNGDVFWVSSTVVPVCDTTDKPVRYVVIMTDITHQKLLETRLSDSQRFYQSITDSIGEGIFSVDLIGHTRFLNPEASRLLGWTLEELQTRRFHDTIQFQSPQRAFIPVQQSPLLKTIRNGEIYFSEETYFTHKDGRIFPVSVTAVPLVDEYDTPRGYVGVFRNISERKNIEEAMRDAYAQAERTNNAKGEFLANMSHEIRTPLNAIIGLTHLVLKTPLTVLQRDYLEKATHSANTLLSIISDILDYSKIEAGKTDLDIQPFCFNDLLEKVAVMFQDRAHSKGLLLLFDMHGDMSVPLLGDESRLMQIFNNLVSNAVKFTHHGEIVVSVKLETLPGNRIFTELRVSDTGIGLSEEQLQHLFDPFTQADASISRKYGGTGLGMSITRHLVELMHGSIAVDSEPDKGSTFVIKLELLRAGNANIAPLPSLGAHQFLTICCLDDKLVAAVDYLNGTLATLAVPHAFCHTHQADSLPEQTTHLLILADNISAQSMAALSEAFKQRSLDYSRLRILTSGNQQDMRQLLAAHGLHQAVVMQLPFTQSSLHNFLSEHTGSGMNQAGYRSLEETAMIEHRLSGKRILIVDDDDISQTVLTQQLSASGIKPHSVKQGADCISLCKQEHFDALIISNKLPDLPGWEVADSLILGSGLTVPIICMSTEDPALITDLVHDSGMCALLSKPINYDELLTALDDFISYPSVLPKDFTLPSKHDDFDLALLAFCQTYQHYGSHVSALVSAFHDDLPHAELDTLKQHASNIGASRLLTQFRKLSELTDSQDKLTGAAELARELDTTVKKAVASLTVMSPETTTTAPEQPISAELGTIIHLLEDYDANAGDALQQLYNNYQQSAHRWVLKQAIRKVSQYDFEAAGDLLRPLMTQPEMTSLQ